MTIKKLFVDMNAYFASVEQQLRPELRHRPVVVAPVMTDSTCCIAVSYEAKPFGINTGMQIGRARRLCSGLQVVEGRPEIYVEVHHKIVEAVESCAHVDEVHSIDEMSCGLIGAQRRPERAVELARQVKAAIRRKVGEYMRCSAGLGPNQFLAKVAAEMQKPNGLTVIAPDDLPHKLYGLDLINLPGIGSRMRDRLHRRGIRTVRQLCALSKKDMRRIWQSVLGELWWHRLRGHDLPEQPTQRRTVGHSHVLPPHLRNEAGARAVLMRLIHKAAARLRHIGYWAGQLSVHVAYPEGKGWKAHAPLGLCQDTLTMVETFCELWKRRPSGEPIRVGVVLLDLVAHRYATNPLFAAEENRLKLARAMDRLNGRFGSNTIYFGGTHKVLESAPTRIAFTVVPDFGVPV